jgi:hypothetical protein
LRKDYVNSLRAANAGPNVRSFVRKWRAERDSSPLWVDCVEEVVCRSALRHNVEAGPGAWANIPPKRNRKDPICFSPYLYRARNLIERFFNKIKQCRRVATRYDKLAANYLAFVKLASIRIWLRANESTP